MATEATCWYFMSPDKLVNVLDATSISGRDRPNHHDRWYWSVWVTAWLNTGLRNFVRTSARPECCIIAEEIFDWRLTKSWCHQIRNSGLDHSPVKVRWFSFRWSLEMLLRNASQQINYQCCISDMFRLILIIWPIINYLNHSFQAYLSFIYRDRFL